MANICLIPEKVNEFRKALKNKTIDMAELLRMSSEERTALFREYAGENAKLVNTLFEEKLVLKNQMQGLKNWASKVAEVGKYDPVRKAELDAMLVDFRARQQERIFSPKETEAFLADLAEARLGSRVTREEAGTMFDLTRKADMLREKFDGQKWESDQARQEYGASKVALERYTEALIEGDTSLKALVRDAYGEFKTSFAENKPRAVAQVLGKIVQSISDNSIALVASVDNSFLGRQGLKTLMTHPSAWWDGAKNSFLDFAKELGNRPTNDALMADIYSRPNYLNGNYDRAKLLPKTEEQYPANLPERIPVLGRLFKASEAAFTGSAIRMRTDLFDLLTRLADKKGLEMDKYQVESIGRLVNSMTARGQWGKRGEPGVVRLILWAPRMLKANIDALTVHAGQDISSFARQQAAMNLAKIVGLTATIMAVSNAIKPGSAELDPRSTDFGKLKFGDTRFDITGGAGSLIVLASRLLTLSSKSPTTGIVTPLNSGEYGAKNGFDVLVDFMAGKTTPAVGAIISLLRGRTPTGDAPTAKNLLMQTQVPISIQNSIDLKDGASADRVAGVLFDFLGISTASFSPSEADWSRNPGVELQQFREKVGDQEFKKANEEFNDKFNEWFREVRKVEKYQALSEDDKAKVITKKKDEIKAAIFKRHGFKYKQQRSKIDTNL